MLAAPWTHPPQHHFPVQMMETMGFEMPAQPPAQASARRKRKAELQPESNERLSKRLSLLNLEQSGAKLYVPVETPQATPALPASSSPPSSSSSSPFPAQKPRADNDSMQLDDTKHKVYIYNLDDELSSESEAEDGKLVFLPDIEKHLRKNRIPAHILAGPDADLASMQLVLYSVPSSISVPEEKDSVRKAIIEARARVREQQEAERKASQAPAALLPSEALNGLNGYSNGPFSQPPATGGASSDLEEMDLD